MPPFCGQEEHLATLASLWQVVSEGGGPRVVVLLAESGLGKTRLAQEFYARTVRAGQGDGGYWPPELGADGDNLLVNPLPGSWNGAARMPFLWWGVRLSPQVGRNQVTTGALAAHVDSHLVPHLEPFHREQRHRQRLAQLAKVGGAVALDAVLDLVPVLGLIKKVGEVGLELKGIHDGWRDDRQALDAAALLGRRRDSLVRQLIDDLSKLFNGPSGSTVPAVILIDDAQFSDADPGVSAFVAALLTAMTDGGWPVLLLVTHWEREFAAAGRDGAEDDASVAAALTRYAGLRPNTVELLHLRPIAGLEPLVTERLPGLTPHQVARLVERAGGNPQYLDEIVRLGLDPRSRRWFEDRDPSGALTEDGLEALLSKSVSLQDVVAERFASSPEGVQRAVSLAGLQGAEFLEPLVRFTHLLLGEHEVSGEEVSAALADASERFGYLAWLAEGLGSFRQRIYHDVAREFLPAFYGEAEALTALGTAVQQLMLGELPLDVGQAGYLSLMRSAAALFERSDDEEQRRLAAQALHELTRYASAAGELEVAHRLAVRQAELLGSISDERLDGDLNWLRGANDILATAGDREARRPVLIRLVRLAGQTYEEGDVNAWSGSLYTQVLLDVAEFHEAAGNQERRADALSTAVAVMHGLEGSEPEAEVLEASLRLHRLYAAWLEELGETGDAAETLRHALGIAQQLLGLDDHPVRRLQVASVQSEVGANALLRGDVQAALLDLERATATLRELAAGGTNIDLEIRLAIALDQLADAYAATGRMQEAEALLLEVLAVMRRHLSMAPTTPRIMANVADSLERLAAVQWRRGDGEGAWSRIQEATAVRRAVADSSGTVPDFALLGYSLTRAAEVALTVGHAEQGEGLVAEALRLARLVWAGDTSARAAWRLIYALKVGLDLALRRMDLTAAHGLLAEVDAVKGRLDAEALAPVTSYLRALEEGRARVLEESGDAEGAARARAAARLEGRGSVN